LNLESGHFTCYKNRTSSRANDSKSPAIEWAAEAMGIWKDSACAPHYFAVNAGSAEQLIDALDRRKKNFIHSV